MSGNKGRRAGDSYKNYYKSYSVKEISQRRARLERHLKNHPQDEQAKKVLDAGPTRRRQKPNKKGGWYNDHQHRPFMQSKNGKPVQVLQTKPGEYRIIAQINSLSNRVRNQLMYRDPSLVGLLKGGASTPYAYQHESDQSKKGKK